MMKFDKMNEQQVGGTNCFRYLHPVTKDASCTPWHRQMSIVLQSYLSEPLKATQRATFLLLYSLFSSEIYENEDSKFLHNSPQKHFNLVLFIQQQLHGKRLISCTEAQVVTADKLPVKMLCYSQARNSDAKKSMSMKEPISFYIFPIQLLMHIWSNSNQIPILN